MTGLMTRAAHGIRNLYDRSISTTAVMDANAYFPAAEAFESEWQSIRKEALSLTKGLESVPRFHEVLRPQEYLSTAGGRDWRVFIPRAYGYDVQNNMALCPVLAKLLKEHPEVVTANISIIDPHKHIPEHRGPFRGITRYTLGLYVPKLENGAPGVVVTIDGKDYRIGSGDSLLWDDTFDHSVVNETDELRIALLLDVYRPNMPIHLRWITNIIISVIGLEFRINKHLMELH